MRKSAGIVMVVAVLTVLRTPSAQDTTTTDPSTEIPTTTLTTTPTTLTTTPPCPIVTCGPGCGYKSGPDGCPTCGCSYYTCEDWACGPYDHCVMQDVECHGATEQCYHPICVPFSETPTPSPPVTTTHECIYPMCGPVCGILMGPDGCLKCRCSDRTCGDSSCGPDKYCVMKDFKCPEVTNQCYYPICVPFNETTETPTNLTTTPPCPIYTCGPYCRLHPGPDGCPICGCSDYTCEGVPCGSDEECVLDDFDCPGVTEQCFIPRCIPSNDTTTSATTLPTTTECQIVYTCPGFCNLYPGPDGCWICGCTSYTCGDQNCGPDQYCVEEEVRCPAVTTRCFNPRCVPTTTSTTISTTTPTTTTPCPVYTCESRCHLYQETDGCLTCHCGLITCKDVTCGPNYYCFDEEYYCSGYPVQCFFPRCLPTTASTTISTTTLTTTPPCPIYTCGPFCGLNPGPDGCPICGCSQSSCLNVKCTPGKECVNQEVECPGATEQCYYPRCIPSNETTTPCPEITCEPGCVEDPMLGRCPICVCPRTCQDINCTMDEECVLQEVVCIRAPCFPEPTCVPRNDSCTGTPNTKICGWPKAAFRWFYNSSANACQKFSYYGCTPSPNTFLSQKTCEDKCKREDPPICIAIACANDCHRLERKNKCPKCICPNPCKGFKCNKGEDCKVREVTCSDEHCPPQPFCDPILPGAASM